MGELAAVAERLRIVKQAYRRFLTMSEIERQMVDPAIDRVAADLEEVHPAARRGNDAVDRDYPFHGI